MHMYYVKIKEQLGLNEEPQHIRDDFKDKH